MAIDSNTATSVAIGAASVLSVALPSGQYQISASGTGGCWVASGANPTAAAHVNGSTFVPVNYPVMINLAVANWKFAVIQDGSATGWASITINT